MDCPENSTLYDNANDCNLTKQSPVSISCKGADWVQVQQFDKNLPKISSISFLDGTFYDSKEVNNRNISEIPHPFIVETMALFEEEKNSEKSKINFIHLNHTNPLLDINSAAYKRVKESGFNTAEFKDVINL